MRGTQPLRSSPRLASRYRVLALDWPGFGGSEPLPSGDHYTSRRFAAVVVDFMNTVGIDKVNVVATDIALVPAPVGGDLAQREVRGHRRLRTLRPYGQAGRTAPAHHRVLRGERRACSHPQ
ncbi:MAG: alpha/beta fold hydrolase [Polyangiales bacterium]